MKMTTKDIPANHSIRVLLRQTYHIAKGEYEKGHSGDDVAFKLHLGLADTLPNLPEARFQMLKTMTRMMIDRCYGAWNQGLNPTIEECVEWVIHQKLVLDEAVEDTKRFIEEQEARLKVRRNRLQNRVRGEEMKRPPGESCPVKQNMNPDEEEKASKKFRTVDGKMVTLDELRRLTWDPWYVRWFARAIVWLLRLGAVLALGLLLKWLGWLPW
jgi:hypothetical protein